MNFDPTTRERRYTEAQLSSLVMPLTAIYVAHLISVGLILKTASGQYGAPNVIAILILSACFWICLAIQGHRVGGLMLTLAIAILVPVIGPLMALLWVRSATKTILDSRARVRKLLTEQAASSI